MEVKWQKRSLVDVMIYSLSKGLRLKYISPMLPSTRKSLEDYFCPAEDSIEPVCQISPSNQESSACGWTEFVINSGIRMVLCRYHPVDGPERSP